jgi:hypothetical protein
MELSVAATGMLPVGLSWAGFWGESGFPAWEGLLVVAVREEPGEDVPGALEELLVVVEESCWEAGGREGGVGKVETWARLTETIPGQMLRRHVRVVFLIFQLKGILALKGHRILRVIVVI